MSTHPGALFLHRWSSPEFCNSSMCPYMKACSHACTPYTHSPPQTKQVHIDTQASEATRISIMAMSNVVHTLYEFAFPIHTGPQAGVVVFVLALPRWRNSSQSPNMIAGVCEDDAASEDDIALSVYDLHLRKWWYTKVNDCYQCCSRDSQSRIVPHVDIVQAKLVLVRDTTVNTIDLEGKNFTHNLYSTTIGRGITHHQSHNLWESLLHAEVHGRVIVPGSTQPDTRWHIFVLVQQTPTMITPVTNAVRFGVWTTTDSNDNQPTTTEYKELLGMQDIEDTVHKQLITDHFRASHVTRNQMELIVESFVMLNSWNYDIKLDLQPIPPELYVVFTCTVSQTNNAPGMRLYVHVQIDTNRTINSSEPLRGVTVTLLGAARSNTQNQFSQLRHVLVPQSTHSEHDNVILARPLIVLIDEDVAGSMRSMHSFELRCAGCTSNEGRRYDPRTRSCTCMEGALSVCVPCVDTFQCSLNEFIFDKISMAQMANIAPQTCRIQPESSSITMKTMLYETCVKCQKHSAVYCPANTVPKSCPPPSKFANIEAGTTVGVCKCGPGFKKQSRKLVQGTGGQYNYEQCDDARGEMCSEECTECADGEICNDLSTRTHKVITCPINTHYTISEHKRNNFIVDVWQRCSCNEGFKNDSMYISESTSETTLDPNIYPATWPEMARNFFSTYTFHVAVARCDKCPPGSYCSGGEQQLCHANSFSRAGSSDCICEPGWYGWMPTSGCSRCLPNHVCLDNEVLPCPTSTSAHLPLHRFCPCPKGYFFDAGSDDGGGCEPCPVGYYCPHYDIKQTHTHDTLAINRAVKCPTSSATLTSKSTNRMDCVCETGNSNLAYILLPEGGECELCRAGSYCNGNTISECPDSSNTNSVPGSSSIESCQCNDHARVIGSGNLCVCGNRFRKNSTSGLCEQCEYPHTSNVRNSLGCETCEDGFWQPSLDNMQHFTHHVSNHIDHPLAVQHRVATQAYMTEYQEELTQAQAETSMPVPTLANTACLLCPPGFICKDNIITVYVPKGADDEPMYAVLPGGCVGDLCMRPCPRPRNHNTNHPRRALAMLGSCFMRTTTWQRYVCICDIPL